MRTGRARRATASISDLLKTLQRASYGIGKFIERPLPPNEAMPKLRDTANSALELDDVLAGAHASLTLVVFLYDWSRSAAETDRSGAIVGRLREFSEQIRSQHHFWIVRLNSFPGGYFLTVIPTSGVEEFVRHSLSL